MPATTSPAPPWTPVAVAAAALASSAVPRLLDLIGHDQDAGSWIAFFGLGAVFWAAFCAGLPITNQWARLLDRRAEAGAAMALVSVVYPAQWFLLAFLGVRERFEATSVLGAVSVCEGAALLSGRWDWPLSALMVGWAVTR